jgi:3-methyladenine DNA glycosylase AlkD
MRTIAKSIGTNHDLALKLWKEDIHEAKHIAIMIADPFKVDEKLMEKWCSEFYSWDLVDNGATLFAKTPEAWKKAVEWTGRKGEFEKRTGFSLMAILAVHDKQAEDVKFEKFFPLIFLHSDDERNFVKKAVNWALRQIGKRNKRLCRKAIQLAKDIHKKNDPASRWIASGVLRELEKYLEEGKIKNIGNA